MPFPLSDADTPAGATQGINTGRPGRRAVATHELNGTRAPSVNLLARDARLPRAEEFQTGPVTCPTPKGKLETASGPAQIEAECVVGADGHQSAVRQPCGIDFVEAGLEVAFSIVDAFVDEAPPRGEGHYFFSPDGLLVVIPLPDGSCRFAATLSDGAPTSDRLDIEHLRAIVAARASKLGAVSQLRDAGWGGSSITISHASPAP
jgi:2-polyprenyl-6-methoxyphenol hydroxylase-like FAD-dependent oxidoreductase